MRRIKRPSLYGITLVVILFAGIFILSYPAASAYWNSVHSSYAVSDYAGVVAGMTEEEKEDLFAGADRYNKHLRQLSFPFDQCGELEEEYYSALKINDNGIIGYVTIDKINVKIPFYHGVSDEVLNHAVGHLEGSSLPVGGESTHAVLCAHSGHPSARLFTDLEKLAEGDLFTITILDRVMTYRIDQISVVEPTEMELLDIVEGKDYCTLITCTPYGVNTHRLLVRGVRFKEPSGESWIVSGGDEIFTPVVILSSGIVLPLLLAVILVCYRRKKSAKLKNR